MLFNRIKDFDFHAALTLEGRKDDELPEQVLAAAKIKNLAMDKFAYEEELPEP